jgi:SpoVK/Ycf46/Vps4 family AAA+-type ATPase
MWIGETPKDVAAIFRTARDEQAVLLFDEADAIATRRSMSVDQRFEARIEHFRGELRSGVRATDLCC